MELTFAQLLLKPVDKWTKTKCLSKLSKNEQFLLSKVQKMTKPKFFFIKQKMLGICDFYNRFSISGPFDLSEWVPDGPEPLGAEDGLGAQQEGSIWNFLEPGGLF